MRAPRLTPQPGIHTNLQVHVSWRTALFWRVVTPLFFKTVPQGAATSVLCATSDKAQPGLYVRPRGACAPLVEWG